MSTRRNGNPNRCPKCRINQELCVCEHLTPFDIASHVSLVVHVRELKLTSNTAQFGPLMLPEKAKIDIRGRVFETFDATPILERPGRPLFLYPHDDALELNDDFKAKYPGPYNLIIPDGNWQQARKVRQREEGFKNLMAVKLPPGITSEYGLRKAQHAEWVCTYEAMAHALGALEGAHVTEKLMTFFRKWVRQTERARAGEFNSRGIKIDSEE